MLKWFSKMYRNTMGEIFLQLSCYILSLFVHSQPISGSSSVGRALVSQTKGRGSESRLPLNS